MRIGIGHDIHQLEPGRKLILGGVEIPFHKGLVGWSDADVLAHAIIDSLLGAAALGDIGTHFPSHDLEYKNISSLILLQRTREILEKNGWQIGNIDATIVAQEPRLAHFVSGMRKQVSHALAIGEEQVSIKAKTADELGFVGRGEGITAHAVALITDNAK